MGRQHEAGKEGVHIDAQPPARDRGRTRRHGDRILDPREQGADLRVETPALIREADRARGPVQEPHADARLEPGDGAADTRGAQRQGCPRKAAAFDDGGQHPDIAHQTSVQRDSPIRDLMS